MAQRPVIMLGIESSCDETAAAIVAADKTIHANEIASQIDTHAKHGGVVPEVAARAHLEMIDQVIRAALATAGMTMGDIDAVAATGGPGLIGGVAIGTVTAKAIAAARNIPYYAVNHLEGHALSPRLADDVAFPYLLLLVSGGHTQLLLLLALDNITVMAQPWMMRLARRLTNAPRRWGLAIRVGLPSRRRQRTAIQNQLPCRAH